MQLIAVARYDVKVGDYRVHQWDYRQLPTQYVYEALFQLYRTLTSLSVQPGTDRKYIRVLSLPVFRSLETIDYVISDNNDRRLSRLRLQWLVSIIAMFETSKKTSQTLRSKRDDLHFAICVTICICLMLEWKRVYRLVGVRTLSLVKCRLWSVKPRCRPYVASQLKSYGFDVWPLRCYKTTLGE